MTTIAEENEKLEAAMRDRQDRLGLGEEIKRRQEMMRKLQEAAEAHVEPVDPEEVRKILQAM